jgi:tRNA1(Val) A37 N6-methylase TrmN6
MADKNMIDKIKHEYTRLYGNLLKDKKLVRTTSLGYSGSAASDAVFGFFEKIKLDRFKSFADLGSGDGKIVLIASLFTKSVGIEIDDELLKISKKMKSKLKLKRAEFIKGDFLDDNISLSKYDVLFINPDNPFYEIEKKLRNEMSDKAILIVCGGLYKPLNMKLEKSYTVDNVKFFVYSNNQ